jgi:hypothetical protein
MLTQIPSMAVEWVGLGVAVLGSDEAQGRAAMDRASLLQMLLRTQSLAPDIIEFLNGETYSLIPSTLVPRFISATKPASQMGMDMLNMHYGLLSAQAAEVTAIGWGLLPSYANSATGRFRHHWCWNRLRNSLGHAPPQG